MFFSVVRFFARSVTSVVGRGANAIVFLMRVLVSETIRAAATYAILRTVMNIEAQRSCPVA